MFSRLWEDVGHTRALSPPWVCCGLRAEPSSLVTPRGRPGREPSQLTLALALASSLHLRLEDLPT